MALLRKRRIFYILMIFTIVFMLFAGRIGWIQYQSANKAVTTSGQTLNEMAVRQREESIELDSGRGQFVDRNGYALTGITQWEPVLFPVANLPNSSRLHSIALQLGTNTDKLRSIWSGLKAPYIWHATNVNSNHTYLSEHEVDSTIGFDILPRINRYREGDNGGQWLGYISQRPDVIRKLRDHNKHNEDISISMQVGAAGLEKTFDSYLRGIGGTRAYFTVDGQKRPLSGIGTRVKGTNDKYYPVRIQTTIDHGIQEKLEQLTEKTGLHEGAIVVLDAKQGDIVAMVSRPFYNPNDVNIKDGSWSNRAVKATVPGSIFKLFIAATALEKQVTTPDEVFHCSGHYGKYGLSCWKHGGHGELTLSEGLARSCNVVFATLGERLSAESMYQMAGKLGLSQKVGWHDESFLDGEVLHQIDQEEAGRVFYNSSSIDGGVLAQTAIGQRDVLVTPLQAANLVVTLLNHGVVYSPRLVSGIYYKDGSTLAQFPVQKHVSREGGIQPHNAKLLLSWMEKVVSDGTGRILAYADWRLAGKSGTAQVIKNGKEFNNQWFIGYGPVGSPKYAVAVLAQNRPLHSDHQAMQIFRSTMNILSSPTDS